MSLGLRPMCKASPLNWIASCILDSWPRPHENPWIAARAEILPVEALTPIGIDEAACGQVSPVEHSVRVCDLPPNASVLIESMRDFGYSLESALADILDNSITAEASAVDILVNLAGASPSICVVDDGRGMSHQELLAAMRLGSRSPVDRRDSDDLGRFGLGLKTASFSQCRRLTVISRKDGVTSAACWDLDFVAVKKTWALQVLGSSDLGPWTSKMGLTGTMVVWEKLDRLFDVDGSDAAYSHAVRVIDEAAEHLEMVFQRFISGEAKGGKVRISLNSRELAPFDPFNSKHPATNNSPDEIVAVAGRSIKIKAFTLPHHTKLRPEEWERNAGRGGYVKNQGFYVYRADRLIIHGTWFGLCKQAELTKLARVRIDVPNSLDALWKVDVRKATASPPPVVRARLRRIINTISATSVRVYTRRGLRSVAGTNVQFWARDSIGDMIRYRLNEGHPLVQQIMELAPPRLQVRIRRLMKMASASLPFPAIFADFGEAPQKVGGESITDGDLKASLVVTAEKLRAAGIELAQIGEMLKCLEPFTSNREATDRLMKEYLGGENV